MKCEHCGVNDATFYCKTSVNGRVNQTHLCHECAEKLGYTQSLQQAMRRGQRRLFDPFALLGDFGMMPRAMLSEFPAPTETGGAESAPQSDLVDAIEAQKLQETRRRNALRAQLENAIAEERYEDAAKLRDQLKALDTAHTEEKGDRC